jgi:hypothetical protein
MGGECSMRKGPKKLLHNLVINVEGKRPHGILAQDGMVIRVLM